MRKQAFILAIIFSIIFSADFAKAQNEGYRVNMNLNKVEDDKLKVEIEVPSVNKKNIEYHIPKIVPGTYSISDFGRFISDFKALDKNGSQLEVDRITDNRWLIKNASGLSKITYYVEDSYDTDKDNVIFEPAGTNIEEGKNFLINTYGFIGYLDGYKDQSYELNITRPAKFYGATSLKLKKSDNNIDTYTIGNYFDLADAPIMYNVPDTTSIMIGGAQILVSVYSPNKLIKSKFVMKNIETILKAQKEYLGGTLPIDKYAFIVYLTDKPGLSGAMGALEHSYSSVYYLPEVNPNAISQTIRDIAAHEFFHIVTPLNIHSEEIHDFDFMEPQMSKHLWLYEGVTEYAANHVQVTEKLIDVDQYLEVVREKVIGSKSYNDTLPFTVMSKLCLDTHKGEYGNVYEKGALIGMSLDILLRNESNGKNGLQDLITRLSEEYGKEKAFKDDELFDKIEELSSPKIRKFFTDYVEGNKPLPLSEILDLVGVDYLPASISRQITLGNVGLGINPDTRRIMIVDISGVNEFGKMIGFMERDEIISINGSKVTFENYMDVVNDFKNNTSENDKVKIVVARKNNNGKFKKKKLQAKAVEVETETLHVIQINSNATQNQNSLRDAWLKQY